MKAQMSSKSCQIRPPTAELAVLGCGQSSTFIFHSFLQVTKTCIKAWMRLNFGQFPPLTMELAALERLKN